MDLSDNITPQNLYRTPHNHRRTATMIYDLFAPLGFSAIRVCLVSLVSWVP